MPFRMIRSGRAFVVALSLLFTTACSTVAERPAGAAESPQARRQALLDFTEAQALDALDKPVPAQPTWRATVRLYRQGALLAQGDGEAFGQDDAIEDATVHLVTPARLRPSREDLAEGRLLVAVTGPDGASRVLEHQGKALEMAGDVVAVRDVTQQDIRATIREQKEYLLRHLDRRYNAFYKLYDARNDAPEDRLRTIYTASGLWTLLQMNDFEADPRIQAVVGPMTEFLLSMQVTEGPNKGAFHYSYYPETRERERRFVVGTASKTIFTLLDLYRRTGDERLLASARAAGDWLATRVGPYGWVYPVVAWSDRNQRFWDVQKQSVLYSSQTLSALSRLAVVTADPAYLAPAQRIARRALRRARDSGWFVGDKFRPPNTISTSWIAMAFLDYHAASKDPSFLDAAFAASHQVLDRLLTDPAAPADHGRYSDTRASSGNGWMNEVLVEVYRKCLALQRSDCGEFEQALRLTTRWLLQNVYDARNAYQIPNPDRARGGSIRGALSYGKMRTRSGDATEVSVRTDAVCHGGNSLIGVVQLLGPRAESSLPEQDLRCAGSPPSGASSNDGAREPGCAVGR